MQKPNLSHQRLVELLEYDPGIGWFYWKIARGRSAKAGARTGWLTKKGYVRLKIDGEQYLAHRLVWFYMTGEMPPSGLVDHENGDRSDNRWLNLRLAPSLRIAMGNTMKTRSLDLPKGVVKNLHGKPYGAQIHFDGHRWLGTFGTIEEASAAYKTAAYSAFGEFALTERLPQPAWWMAAALSFGG